ncbi:MAG: Ig-like domain-containing protein, partial [Candidatus Limnocylindria bacterium]
MRRALLRFLAVAAVGAAVLAGVLYLATTLDARPPSVTAYRLSQHLSGDETAALTTTSLEVVFSENVDLASAEAAFSIEPAVEGAFSWSGTTMTFTPAERLPLETAFEVVVGPGIRDEAGNAMQQPGPPFSFVTVGRPMVVDSEPADGAAEVPLDATIAISFSTLMDTPSVEAALEIAPNLAHELRWSGERLEIVPTRALAPGERYELRIGPDAADLTGQPLAEPFTMTFETLASSLDPTALVPADGVEGIAVTTPIAVLFD